MATQGQARIKEIDDVQEEIRKALEKLDKGVSGKKTTSGQKGG